MTEKEKAKAYDEALERAKKLHDKIDIKEIFPELNESEDERIKKAIIEFFESEDDDTTYSLVRKKDIIAWLERQGKKSSWKPSKEEMDVLYSLSYITNEYDEHKEDVITHLYQDLKREFFNDSSYENMFSLDNKEDDVRRRSTIQILEYARSLDAYNQYGKADIDKNIAWLEKQGKEEYGLKSFKDEDVRKFMQYIEKQTKAYEFNLPNRSYDIYAFAKDLLVWLEKQSEQESSQINERVWLYLISDVLTWKDGIGQYLDDPRVQELAKRLCKEYAQKLYNPSNTGKNEQKSADKIEPRFKVGDWVVNKFGDSWYIDSLDKKNYQVSDGKGNYNYFPISKQDEMHFWTAQDAKVGDVLANDHHILILKELVYDWSSNGTPFITLPKLHSVKAYCGIKPNGNFEIGKDKWCFCGTLHILPATKEQRDLLFQKIKEAGYEWDVDKKELKKLVKPKFKVGDMVRHKKTNRDDVYEISKVYEDSYCIDGFPWLIFMEYQDQYELVTNKFDPKTLKPLDRVLAKNDSSDYNL